MRKTGLNHADGNGDLSKDEFDAYERVRQSGATNMYAIGAVCDLSGLDEKDVRYIMSNYERLSAKFYPDGIPDIE